MDVEVIGLVWSLLFAWASTAAIASGHDEGCPGVATIERLPSPRWTKHRIVPRERLDQIAHRYGVSVADILEWNELEPGTEAKTGAVLRIRSDRRPPPRQRVAYVVQEGDTWWRVAASHGVDSKDLRAYNWPYKDKMTPGERLRVWIDPLVHDWIRSSAQVLPGADARSGAADAGSEVGADTGSEAGSDVGMVRRGGVGIGPPGDGRLLNGVRIPEGPGYALRFPATAHGTTFAVEALLAGIERFRRTSGYAGVLRIGSISAVRGGPIGSHRSHQTGRDVDLRLPRRAGVPRGIPLTARRIDWLATWHLIEAFSGPEVSVIFLDYAMQRHVARAALAAGMPEARVKEVLQYPRGSRIASALVRDAYGHDKHMHVRFRCGPCEPECVDARDEEHE